MGLRALVSASKTVLLGFTVLFLFQNCDSIGGSLQLSPGNGGGYEGLTGDPSQGAPPAVLRYVFVGACSDANQPESVIVFDGQYHLTVDACQIVTPSPTLDTIAVDGDGRITYGGRTYEVR